MTDNKSDTAAAIVSTDGEGYTCDEFFDFDDQAVYYDENGNPSVPLGNGVMKPQSTRASTPPVV
jgi:hypothetical protein